MLPLTACLIFSLLNNAISDLQYGSPNFHKPGQLSMCLLQRAHLHAGRSAGIFVAYNGRTATEFHRELVTLGPGSKGTDNVALKDGFNARIGKNW